MMKSNKIEGTVIDVREPLELFLGKVKGSVNIPMGSIPSRLDELKKLPKPLIFVCASGNRSGQVVAYLQSQKWKDVRNGGAWKAYQKMAAG
jgi:rhodanese-related sulfurtransferase